MKRTIYTLALVAFFGLMSNAQTAEPAELKKEKVNNDGTLAPAQATSAHNDDGTLQKVESKSEQKPAGGGTRMAITEKGVPASKTTEQKPKAEPKKTEATKTEKH